MQPRRSSIPPPSSRMAVWKPSSPQQRSNREGKTCLPLSLVELYRNTTLPPPPPLPHSFSSITPHTYSLFSWRKKHFHCNSLTPPLPLRVHFSLYWFPLSLSSLFRPLLGFKNSPPFCTWRVYSLSPSTTTTTALCRFSSMLNPAPSSRIAISFAAHYITHSLYTYIYIYTPLYSLSALF